MACNCKDRGVQRPMLVAWKVAQLGQVVDPISRVNALHKHEFCQGSLELGQKKAIRLEQIRSVPRIS
jgi:hypothetical protein